jgi:hypothetical protein
MAENRKKSQTLSEAKHLHYLLEKEQMQILRFASLRSESVTFFNLAEKWH